MGKFSKQELFTFRGMGKLIEIYKDISINDLIELRRNSSPNSLIEFYIIKEIVKKSKNDFEFLFNFNKTVPHFNNAKHLIERNLYNSASVSDQFKKIYEFGKINDSFISLRILILKKLILFENGNTTKKYELQKELSRISNIKKTIVNKEFEKQKINEIVFLYQNATDDTVKRYIFANRGKYIKTKQDIKSLLKIIKTPYERYQLYLLYQSFGSKKTFRNLLNQAGS